MPKGGIYTGTRANVYDTILSTMEDGFGKLGKLAGQEIMVSYACTNMRMKSNYEYRYRRNLMLYWSHGWLKSTFLEIFYNLTERKYCKLLARISEAALCGTVRVNNKNNRAQFVPPAVLYPILFITELGQVKVELMQNFLNILAEGHNSVDLAAVNELTPVQKVQIEKKYGIKFDKSGSGFEYYCSPTVMVATYSRKYLMDNAMTSRFTVVMPDFRLDSDLAYDIEQSPEVILNDPHIKRAFNRFVFEEDNPIDPSQIVMPDEGRDIPGLSPRIINEARMFRAGMEWWGQYVTDKDILKRMKRNVDIQNRIWTSNIDRIYNALQGNKMTVSEIVDSLGIPQATVYRVLRKLRPELKVKRDGKVRYYYV